RERSEIVFVFVGDGKEKQTLEGQAEALGLKNVRFVPSVPKNEIAEVLAAADACIAILKPLELYKTTYPNKVFDYMAAGRPVLLAIDGVIRELVEQAGCGIAVPPGDPRALARAAMTLADRPEEARRMGAAGRRAIETEFRRDRFAAQFARILEEMR
ncbi:MAG: glycosyltransferase family 4 protein, partial [Verrucomicrobiota bacterium]|nr:glycosyltransferase family 4 protein [Verrucomicrobiota bacterium]